MTTGRSLPKAYGGPPPKAEAPQAKAWAPKAAVSPPATVAPSPSSGPDSWALCPLCGRAPFGWRFYLQTREPPVVLHGPWSWIKGQRELLAGRFPKGCSTPEEVLGVWRDEVSSGRAIDHWRCKGSEFR